MRRKWRVNRGNEGVNPKWQREGYRGGGCKLNRCQVRERGERVTKRRGPSKNSKM